MATQEQIEIAAAWLAGAVWRHSDAMRHAYEALHFAGIPLWTKCNVDVWRGWIGHDSNSVQAGYDIGFLAREIYEGRK